MKRLLLILFVALILSGCTNRTPLPSRIEEIPIEEDVYGTDYWGNITFKGKKKIGSKWLFWDESKICPGSSYEIFRTRKDFSNSKINEWDTCDRCKKRWDKHKDDL